MAGLVALALHHHHGGVGAAEGADVFEPVGEWVAALEGIVVVVAGHQGLLLRRPEQHKYCCGAHKQGVGAVVCVLAAEIPEVLGGILFSKRWNGARGDAVGGRHRRIEGFSGEVAAELGFSHTAIAKYEDFYAIDGDGFYLLIEDVGAEGGEAVVEKTI